MWKSLVSMGAEERARYKVFVATLHRTRCFHLIQVRRNVTSWPRRETATADDDAAPKGREEEGGGGASRPDVTTQVSRIRIRAAATGLRAP